MHETSVIVEVAVGEISGVEGAESVDECGDTTFVIYIESLVAYIGRNGRKRVDAFGHGVDIHHRAATHHGIVACGPYCVERGEGFLLIHGRAVIFLKPESLYEVMAHARKLFGRGDGCAYRYAAKNLPRVGRHYFSVEALGNIYCKVGLAASGRTGDYDKCFHALAAVRRAMATMTSVAFSIDGMGTNS